MNCENKDAGSFSQLLEQISENFGEYLLNLIG